MRGCIKRWINNLTWLFKSLSQTQAGNRQFSSFVWPRSSLGQYVSPISRRDALWKYVTISPELYESFLDRTCCTLHPNSFVFQFSSWSGISTNDLFILQHDKQQVIMNWCVGEREMGPLYVNAIGLSKGSTCCPTWRSHSSSICGGLANQGAGRLLANLAHVKWHWPCCWSSITAEAVWFYKQSQTERICYE